MSESNQTLNFFANHDLNLKMVSEKNKTWYDSFKFPGC